MNDRYRVDLTQLTSTIEAMQTFDDNAAGILDDVDRDITALHLSSWSGDAAEAQLKAHNRWSADAQRMHDALKVLTAAAERAHHNYGGAHGNNVEMWSLD